MKKPVAEEYMLWLHLNEEPMIVKFTEAVNRMLVTREHGKRQQEVLVQDV